MTTNRDVYEGKILETLIKNSERLAVVEQKLDVLDQKFENKFNTLNQKIDEVDTVVKLAFRNCTYCRSIYTSNSI